MISILETSDQATVIRVDSQVIKIYHTDAGELESLSLVTNILETNKTAIKRLIGMVTPSETMLRFITSQNIKEPYAVLPYKGIDVLTAIETSIPITPEIVYEMVYALEEFHSVMNSPYGDVKLENFLLNNDEITLIDYQEGTYTPSYMSRREHYCKPILISSDFESLGYAILYTKVGEALWFTYSGMGSRIVEYKEHFVKKKNNRSDLEAIRQFIVYAEDYPITREEMLDTIPHEVQQNE